MATERAAGEVGAASVRQTERIGTRANAQPALPGCSCRPAGGQHGGRQIKTDQVLLPGIAGSQQKSCDHDCSPDQYPPGLQIDVIQALPHAAINFRAKKSLSG
jgi:hypothetical protein